MTTAIGRGVSASIHNTAATTPRGNKNRSKDKQHTVKMSGLTARLNKVQIEPKKPTQKITAPVKPAPLPSQPAPVDPSSRVQAVTLAANSPFPAVVYQLIREYEYDTQSVNVHEMEVQNYFLNDYCSHQRSIYDNRKEVAARFKDFVVNGLVDLEQVRCINFSHFDFSGYISGVFWRSLHNLLCRERQRPESDLLVDLALAFVFSLLPNLRKVVAQKAPGFANSFFNIESSSQEIVQSRLEIVDLSYNLEITDDHFQKFCTTTSQLHPKLTTLILTGCNISPDLLAFAKRTCPHIQLVIEPTSRVEATSLATKSILPMKAYQLIREYEFNEPGASMHEVEVQGYFLKNCYTSYWNIPCGQQQVEAVFKRFVASRALDLTQVHRINLSGLNCAAHKGNSWVWKASHSLHTDLGVAFIFSQLPNLREVVAANAPGFTHSFFTVEHTFKECQQSKLEKVDLSNNWDIQPFLLDQFLKCIFRAYPHLSTLIIGSRVMVIEHIKDTIVGKWDEASRRLLPFVQEGGIKITYTQTS